MAYYYVTIRATVTKTTLVEATCEQEATNEANGKFSLENDGEEHYTQEVLDVEQAKRTSP